METIDIPDKSKKTSVLTGNTQVPVYMVYAIGCALVAITAYMVTVSASENADNARLDRQREAIIRHDQMFVDMAKTQNETANALHEVMGELKYLRETRR